MIYIIQCLCVNRHAIYAIGYDPEKLPHDVALAGLQQLIADWVENKVINPWCGICESRVWTFEQRRTKYRTMEEAEQEMRLLELENLLTRAQIEERKAAKN